MITAWSFERDITGLRRGAEVSRQVSQDAHSTRHLDSDPELRSPEPTGFAPHATALAEHLARTAGYDVTVVTGFPFAPRWKRWLELEYAGRVSSVKCGRTASGSGACRTSSRRRPGSVLAADGDGRRRGALSGGGRCARWPRCCLKRRRKPDAACSMSGPSPGSRCWPRSRRRRQLRAPYFVNIERPGRGCRRRRRDRAFRRGEVRARDASSLPRIRRAAGASVLCPAASCAPLVAHGYSSRTGSG